LESKPLFGHFSLKQLDLLSNIVKQAALYGLTKNTDSVRKSCVRLLAAILPYKTALFDSKSILEIDAFHLLVSLSLAMPNLYDSTNTPHTKLNHVSNGGLNDSNIFKLVLQAHSVQIVLAKFTNYTNNTSPPGPLENENEYDDREDVELVKEFFRHIFSIASEKSILKCLVDEEKTRLSSILNKNIVYSWLVKGLMPFLRCSALFFSNLTDIAPTITINGIFILKI
jgi:hypothetical protein